MRFSPAGDARRTRSIDRHRRHRGQSLVEFAIVLPILLLLTLIALDFGRVYLGWINLQSMSRIAANLAANNPTAWQGGGDANVQAKYQNQIRNDAAATNCKLPLVRRSADGAGPRLRRHGWQWRERRHRRLRHGQPLVHVQPDHAGHQEHRRRQHHGVRVVGLPGQVRDDVDRRWWWCRSAPRRMPRSPATARWLRRP